MFSKDSDSITGICFYLDEKTIITSHSYNEYLFFLLYLKIEID